jgi:hypothetical protein
MMGQNFLSKTTGARSTEVSFGDSQSSELGLAPDDSLLLLKDMGTQDIYTLDWEQP